MTLASALRPLLNALVHSPVREKRLKRQRLIKLLSAVERRARSVSCTIRATDDFVVSRLSADLPGVKRLDVFKEVDGGGMQGAMRDVPFDPAAGEAGGRTLGEYTFNHSAE